MNAYRDQYAQLFRDGRNVVLIAISADADTMQAAWARESEFPFLFASDSGAVVGRAYGALASRPTMTNRNQMMRWNSSKASSKKLKIGVNCRLILRPVAE